jgi:hypothetical protein
MSINGRDLNSLPIRLTKRTDLASNTLCLENPQTMESESNEHVSVTHHRQKRCSNSTVERVAFRVFMTVDFHIVKGIVPWNITLCSLVDNCRRFGETCYLNHHGRILIRICPNAITGELLQVTMDIFHRS